MPPWPVLLALFTEIDAVASHSQAGHLHVSLLVLLPAAGNAILLLPLHLITSWAPKLVHLCQVQPVCEGSSCTTRQCDMLELLV